MKPTLIGVTSLGKVGWKTLSKAFSGTGIINFTAGDTDTSLVQSTQEMFKGCSDLLYADVDMDTSSLIRANDMFLDCTDLKEATISDWDITALQEFETLFLNSKTSCLSYTKTLNKWDAQLVHQDLSAGFGNSTYSVSAEVARNHLITSDNWSITDAGECQEPAVFLYYIPEEVSPSNIYIEMPWGSNGNIIDWGDSSTTLTSNTDVNKRHYFTKRGYHTVKFYGALHEQDMTRSFSNLVEVLAFGAMNGSTLTPEFPGANELKKITSGVYDCSVGIPNFSMNYTHNSLEEIHLTISAEICPAANLTNRFINCILLNKVTIDCTYQKFSIDDAHNAFAGCPELGPVNLSGLDFSNCSTAQGMFQGCSKLELDYSSMSGANIVDMSYFMNNAQAKDLDLGTWNLNNTLTLHSAFKGADIDSVILCPLPQCTTTQSMFEGSSITLPYFSLIAPNLICTAYMFMDTNIVTLPLAQYNSALQDVQGMFKGCTSLNYLDLSATSNWVVQNYDYFLQGCTSLQIQAEHLDLSLTTSAQYMFDGVQSVLNVKDYNVLNLTQTQGMFKNTRTSLDLGTWSVPTRNIEEMFMNSTINLIDLSGFTGEIGFIKSCFMNCSNLSSINLKNLKLQTATDFSYIFHGCPKLSSLDLVDWDLQNSRNLNNTFSSCPKLLNIDISNFDVSGVQDFNNLFTDSLGLKRKEYDKVLINWANLNVFSNQSPDFSLSNYSLGGQAQDARNTLINSDLWTITDAGGLNNEMISTWRTTQLNESITLPLVQGFTYNFTVDWGDGSQDTITSYNCAEVTHVYGYPRDYTIEIQGVCEAWSFNNSGDKDKIISVQQMGGLGWTTYDGMFYGCSNLESSTSDGCLSSLVTSAKNMYRECTSLVSADQTYLDAQSMTDISGMFMDCPILDNIKLSHLDISLVTAADNLLTNTQGLSLQEYDLLLENWGNLNVQTSVNVDFGPSIYTNESQASAGRDILISKLWNITDAGLVEQPLTFIVQAQSVTLGLFPETYDMIIDWGDGTKETNQAQSDIVHDYAGAGAGQYTIKIYGLCPKIKAPQETIEVIQLGKVQATSYADMFSGTDLVTFNLGIRDVSLAPDFSYMFYGCPLVDVDISGLDVSGITSMDFMFGNTGPNAISEAVYSDMLINYDLQVGSAPVLADFGSVRFAKESLADYARDSLIAKGWTITDGGEIAPMEFIIDLDDGYKQFVFPLSDQGTYNLQVDWGDGTSDTLTDYNDAQKTHVYDVYGSYTVKVEGQGDILDWDQLHSGVCLVQVKELGTNGWVLENLFNACPHLITFSVGVGYHLGSGLSAKGMFKGCYWLQTVDLTGIDFSDCLDTSSMFYYCADLVTIDLSGHDFTSVTLTKDMFYHCDLSGFDCSIFDGNQLQDTSGMFFECFNIQNIDISNWDITSLVHADDMFTSTSPFSSEIYDITLNNWAGQVEQPNVNIDFGVVKYHTNVSGASRDQLVANGWNIIDDGGIQLNGTIGTVVFNNPITVNVPFPSYGTGYDFEIDWGDGVVQQLNDSNYYNTTHHYEAGTYTFTIIGETPYLAFHWTDDGHIPWSTGLTSIEQLGVGSYRISGTFTDCDKLETFTWGSLKTVPTNNSLWQTFRGCTSLVAVDLNGIGNLTAYNGMFGTFLSCSSLVTLDLSMVGINGVEQTASMFDGCTSLTQIDFGVGGLQTDALTAISNMFTGCTSLDLTSSFNSSNIRVQNWDVSICTDFRSMFSGVIKVPSLSAWTFDADAPNYTFGTETENHFMENTYMETADYDATLASWKTQPLLAGRYINFGYSTYTDASSRNTIENTYGWEITDGGYA